MSSPGAEPSASASPANDALVDQTISTVRRHLLPVLFSLYLISYLDRANVAFAKQDMSAALGFSEAVFGFGAGIFFLGYFLFEIPGAILVERWSARKWFCRILITWGACTILLGFVHSDRQFYWVRFLLGSAEAGFFPGVLVYLSHWFPMRYRAEAVSRFALAIPFSFVIGGPISGWLLRQHWWGVEGWRWVFIVEGIPAILAGVLVFLYLPDRPSDVRWLRPEQREWLVQTLEKEKEQRGAPRPLRQLASVLFSAPALLLGFALLFANFGLVSFLLWLPANIQKAGTLSASSASVLTAIPFLVTMVAIWIAGKVSDTSGERFRATWLPMLSSVFFFLLTAIPDLSLAVSLTIFSLTAAGLYAWAPSFWVLPNLFWTGSDAAAAIGFINSTGNLGGFFGPVVAGYLLTRYSSHATVVVVLSASVLLSALCILVLRRYAHQHFPAPLAAVPEGETPA